MTESTVKHHKRMMYPWRSKLTGEELPGRAHWTQDEVHAWVDFEVENEEALYQQMLAEGLRFRSIRD